jgi:antitoxin CcdA
MRMIMENTMPAPVRSATEKAQQRALLWRKTNQAALESSNAYVAQHGLPLAKYRCF